MWVLAPLTEGESPPHRQECVLWASSDGVAPGPFAEIASLSLAERLQALRCGVALQQSVQADGLA